MEFTPENLLTLPIGEYTLIRKPFSTNPDYIEKTELCIWDNKGNKSFYIGNNVISSFTIEVKHDDEDMLYFIAFVAINNSVFNMSDYSISELKKYEIKIPSA